MIEYILASVVLLVLGAWVTKPLFAPRAESLTEVDEQTNDLLEMKHAVYRSILDLEFDLKVGKVSKEDHDILRRRYEEEASHFLKQLDEVEGLSVSAMIEREIAEVRKRR